MFLFMVLLLVFLILVAFLVLAISVFGATAIVIFGDVIVCAFIIIWIVKKLFFKKKE